MLSSDSLPDCPAHKAPSKLPQAHMPMSVRKIPKREYRKYSPKCWDKNTKTAGIKRSWEAKRRRMPAKNLPSQIVWTGQGKSCKPDKIRKQAKTW